MRRLWLCVPMISLMLLPGCSAGGGVSKAEQQALLIRSEYLEHPAYSSAVRVISDYGQRVYEYEMTVTGDGDETTLVLTEPDEVAGMTAHLSGSASQLEFEDLVLETGPLDAEGLSPASAVPAMVSAVREGYISTCSFTEDGRLRVDCCDPEQKPDRGTAVSLWFANDTHALTSGEILVDGSRVITCEFSNFTMG